MNKTCRLCSAEKPLEAFVKEKRSKDGRRNLCKPCSNTQFQAKYRAKYRAERPDYGQENWTYVKASGRKALYTLAKTPIGPYDYAKLFDEQNGVCKICKDPPGNKRLAVDHNHTTGKVRGLLCGRCNTMLGMARENLTILEEGISYLARENSN